MAGSIHTSIMRCSVEDVQGMLFELLKATLTYMLYLVAGDPHVEQGPTENGVLYRDVVGAVKTEPEKPGTRLGMAPEATLASLA